MMNFLNRLLRIAQGFKLWDYVWFKLTLVSAGVILGMYFHQFFFELRPLLWILFGISYLIMIVTVVKNYKKQ